MFKIVPDDFVELPTAACLAVTGVLNLDGESAK
jgi:hypothetical protein